VRDGLWAQFVVPGLVAVDPAQPVRGAVLGQPRHSTGGPDVDRVSRHVGRLGGGGHPAGSFRLRAVLGDGLLEQMRLVLRGPPATVDDELDPVARGIGCGLAYGSEEVRIEVGDPRYLVIEDRRAVGNRTGGLAKRITEITADASGVRWGARCSLRGTVFGGAAVGDEDAVEDEGPDNGAPRAAAIAAMTASSPATRRLRIRVRRALVRADLLLVTPRVKGAWCCQRVCDFRYADDMCRLVASEHARVAG
jgi:hypothetical protein